MLDARADLLAKRHERKWQPSPAEPALVIAVDELAELDADSMALFERLARIGRAEGIILIALTQRPSADVLGGLDARTQMAVRIALGVVEPRDGELILGAGRVGAAGDQTGWPGWGTSSCWRPVSTSTRGRPAPYWLTDATVSATAGRSGVERAALDAVSAAAADMGVQAPERARQGWPSSATTARALGWQPGAARPDEMRRDGRSTPSPSREHTDRATPSHRREAAGARAFSRGSAGRHEAARPALGARRACANSSGARDTRAGCQEAPRLPPRTGLQPEVRRSGRLGDDSVAAAGLPASVKVRERLDSSRETPRGDGPSWTTCFSLSINSMA